METLESITNKLLEGSISSAEAEEMSNGMRICNFVEKNNKFEDGILELKSPENYSYLTYHFEGDVCWIDYIGSDLERSGMASQLVEDLKSKVLKKNISSINISVSEDNFKGYKHALKQGFVETGWNDNVFPRERDMQMYLYK